MSGPVESRLAPDDGETIERFRAAGQGQVFRFLDELSGDEVRELLDDAASLDLELVARLFREGTAKTARKPDLAPLSAIESDDPRREEAKTRGHELLRRGEVGFYTVAGGQATRLKADGPKGAYPVGPYSGKTLFEWHAEKVRAAARRYGKPIPWVILVSRTNERETREFLASHDDFGLGDAIRLVPQRMLPAVDGEGRILLRTRSRIFLSPNGHGGSIDPLGRYGAIDWLRGFGVKYLSYFQVDNALLSPADPAFLGYQALNGAEMTVKVVRKRNAEEKAGVVVVRDGRPGVVEYSEIDEDDAAKADESGKLVYGLANIAAHGFSLDFLERLQGVDLPYHMAKKDVETLDESGAPRTVEGRKYEKFVFDAIPLAEGFFAFLTERSEEFAPLKNADGDDSPDTVRAALLERTRRWYERAGEPAPTGEALEMSPLTAYDYDTFREWLASRGAGR